MRSSTSSSSVSSQTAFSSARGLLPRGLLWMMALVILLEVATRFLWSPNLVGPARYGRYSTSYSFGYDEAMPLFFRVNDELVVYSVRGREIPEQRMPAAKRPAEFRVFVFGASTSWGPGSYPAFMTRELSARRPGVEWTTINLSVYGVGSSRMALILSKAMAFEPDLVLLAPHGSNEYEDERDLAYVHAVNSGYKAALFKSRAVVLLKQVFDQHLSFRPDQPPTLDFEEEETASLKPENLTRWRTTLGRNMRDMVQRARDWHVPVVLVGRAERDRTPEGRDSTRSEEVNDILRQLATTPDVVFFDQSAAIDASFPASSERTAAFLDESHLRPQGHAAVGEALATLVLSRFRPAKLAARLN